MLFSEQVAEGKIFTGFPRLRGLWPERRALQKP